MSDALSLFNAGTEALRSGAITTATQLLRAAVAAPADPPVRAAATRNLGIALRRSGDDCAAAEVFEAALQIDETDIDARYNLGNTMVALGNHTQDYYCFGNAFNIYITFFACEYVECFIV